MKKAEGVSKTTLQQERHLLALLVGKAWVHPVGLGVLQVYLLMRHIQVATIDDGLLLVQSREIAAQVVFPLHAIVQALEPILRVGRVAAHQEEVVHLQGDESALGVVLLNAHAIGDAQRLMASEDGSTAIALLFGIVPIGGVARYIQVYLSSLQLGFLKAEEVGIQLVECFQKVLAHYGAESVYVPTDEFHIWCLCFLGGVCD